MTRGRVIVVGSVNVDLVVVAPRLPAPGETVTGGDVARHHGGKGGNQAVAAARLGADVSFVGAVGRDDFGAAAREALRAEGVATAHLGAAERPTGVALIIVDDAAENLIAVAPGANETVEPTAVEEALAALAVGPADVVLACREIPPPAVRAALAAARAAGATTILNPAPADGLDPRRRDPGRRADPQRARAGAPGILDRAGDRGGSLGGRPGLAVAVRAESVARHLLATGRPGRSVVVTLGAAGALVVPDGGPAVTVPAVRVAPVDTTGAGDTFNGALAAGLAAGLPLADAARRAVAAAGLSTTRPGARGGMPSAAEVDAFLAGA